MVVLVDPRGQVRKPAQEQGKLAPRPATLDGLTIGFLDNQKWNVGPLFNEMEKLIRQKYSVKEVIRRKTHFARVAPKEVVNELVEKCDVVINGAGD